MESESSLWASVLAGVSSFAFPLEDLAGDAGSDDADGSVSKAGAGRADSPSIASVPCVAGLPMTVIGTASLGCCRASSLGGSLPPVWGWESVMFRGSTDGGRLYQKSGACQGRMAARCRCSRLAEQLDPDTSKKRQAAGSGDSKTTRSDRNVQAASVVTRSVMLGVGALSGNSQSGRKRRRSLRFREDRATRTRSLSCCRKWLGTRSPRTVNPSKVSTRPVLC